MSARLGSRAECTYFAQPYSLSATGFYFTDLADYQAKAAIAVDDYGAPVEEFEIQFIDGDFAKLFGALSVNQANLPEWFELAESLDSGSDQYLIACHVADLGYDISDLRQRCDDYFVFRGSASDYASEIVRDCYTVPRGLEGYIDYDKFARDLILNGDIEELDYDLILVRG